jgi:hypothetical protein
MKLLEIQYTKPTEALDKLTVANIETKLSENRKEYLAKESIY